MPTEITKLSSAERDHVLPEFVPGTEAVLFTSYPAVGGLGAAHIAVLDLRTGTTKVLVRGGSHPHDGPTEHRGLQHRRDAACHRIRPPTSRGIRLVHASARRRRDDQNWRRSGRDGRQWLAGVRPRNRRGATERGIDGSAGTRHATARPAVRCLPPSSGFARWTPTALSASGDIWIYDFARATLSPLTTDPASDVNPLWTIDGQRIVFTSDPQNYPEIFWRPADGTGSDERLLTRGKDLTNLFATSWSRDGKQLVFSEVPQNLQVVLGQLAVEDATDVKILIKGTRATISPDGQWIAYESNAAGRFQIFAERYPLFGSRLQIYWRWTRRTVVARRS